MWNTKNPFRTPSGSKWNSIPSGGKWNSIRDQQEGTPLAIMTNFKFLSKALLHYHGITWNFYWTKCGDLKKTAEEWHQQYILRVAKEFDSELEIQPLMKSWPTWWSKRDDWHGTQMQASVTIHSPETAILPPRQPVTSCSASRGRNLLNKTNPGQHH